MIKKTFGLVMLACCALFAQGAVTVDVNGQSWRYQQNPRLATILEPVALQQDWYWPAAALYNVSDNAAEQERQVLLQQLEKLTAGKNAELDSTLTKLSRYIAGWHLATRRELVINYDLARLENRFNPALDNGDYKLSLTTRPQTVQFWGAVEQVVTLAHSGVTQVVDYLPSVSRSRVAELDYVLVILPTGEVKQVGVASWNQQYTELMPGASVYIPFAGGLLSGDLMQLNKDIAGLARHRVK
jgi:hypothetical protein